MAEIPTSSPEQFFDVTQAQHLLGYAVEPTPAHLLQPGMADERQAILDDALRAKETLRSDMVRAAKEGGIDVPESVIAGWEPNEAEVQLIRERLRPLRVRARILDSCVEFIEDQRLEAAAHGTPFRPHQQDMTIKTAGFMAYAPRQTDEGGKGGYHDGPPGVGKTGVISAVCSMVKYNEDPEERVKIVILTDSVDVSHQTKGHEGDRGLAKFAPHLDVGIRFQGLHDLNHDILVMPVASAMVLMERGEMPWADVVVFDEVDAYARQSQGERLRDYIKDKIALGLSASIDDVVRDLLPYEIYSLSMPDAIHMRLLAEMTGEVLQTPIDHEAIKDLPRAEREAKKLRARMDDVKLRVRRHVRRGEQVIIRVPAGDDLTIAKTLAREISEDEELSVPNDGTFPPQIVSMTRKVRARVVGGSEYQTAKGRKEGRTIIDDFRPEGEQRVEATDVLVVVKAAGRGTDMPKLAVGYDLDPRGGWREKHQFHGRPSRLYGDKHAYIYSYSDPDYPDQYTAVMALGGQPGQTKVTLRHGPPVSMPTRRRAGPRPKAALPDSVAGGVLAETVDSISVLHDEGAPDVRQEEDPTRPMTFEEVCNRLGVSATLMAGVYEVHGFRSGDVLRLMDLEAMLELSHPSLNIMPLPERGYTSLEEVLELADLSELTEALIRLHSWYSGFTYRKFLKPDGTAGFFFADEDVFAVIEKLNESPERPKS
jgi:superfamily II DNA or RNA helicase